MVEGIILRVVFITSHYVNAISISMLLFQELEKEIATASEEQQKHTDRALGALNGFLKERLFLRVSLPSPLLSTQLNNYIFCYICIVSTSR
jgi:hypothetical protein